MSQDKDIAQIILDQATELHKRNQNGSPKHSFDNCLQAVIAEQTCAGMQFLMDDLKEVKALLLAIRNQK